METRKRSLLPILLLLAAPAWGGCVAATASGPGGGAQDLGAIGSKTDSATSRRTVHVDIAAGAYASFVVHAVRFHAAIAQDGTVPGHLSAKSSDLSMDGDTGTAPQIDVVASDDMQRTWTLVVHNDGDAALTGTLTVTAIEEIGDSTGLIRQTQVMLAANETQRFRVRAASMQVDFNEDAAVTTKLAAKNYDVEVDGQAAANPTLVVHSPDDEVRNWTLTVTNLESTPVGGTLVVHVLGSTSMPPPTSTNHGLPTVSDPVQYENDWCVYQDTIPYVKSVKWNNPDVQAAMAAIAPGWHSTFSYSEWKVAYGLENDRTGTEVERMQKIARNYLRVLCGEHRDYPAMLAAKLHVLIHGQHYAGPDEMTSVDTTTNLFTQLTLPAYTKMVETMRVIHAYRQSQMPGDKDGFNYGFGEAGHGSNRVDHSVPPFTQCEMKFMFTHYMTADAPSTVDPATYETEYGDYEATQCSAEDLGTMFNFRGHVVFQPMWLESNAFLFNSRRARGAETSRGDRSYYLHPFATRRAESRSAFGTYLFYPDADQAKMVRASENGGGPILYITDQDTDRDGLQDYRLFDMDGCGDNGVSSAVPSQNCNMVPWDLAWSTPSTTGHASGWDPSYMSEPGMGFMKAFTTFDQRMARFNQALDRHTNWGPTGYYMLDASDPGDTSPRYFDTYSPVVAASYDVSASDYFVHRDFPSTSSFEQGRAKWLYVMRFPTSEYYDETAMAAGRPMDFDADYFNETSLSNDFYRERALDHFGYIPASDMYAQVYLTYGDRGEQPPALPEIPAPSTP